MSISNQIKEAAVKALQNLYGAEFSAEGITVSTTKPEFEGDYTIVLFGFVKQLKKSPDILGNEIGNYLVSHQPDIFVSFSVVKGFLNFVISDKYWLNFLPKNYQQENYGLRQKTGRRVMVEYSSPNTNKPLHLGHLRNIFLGWSMSEILKANGNEIVKTCIVNDRGIHICKSMIAWQLFANGATPGSTGIKGDHFTGDYYVKFNDEYKAQVKELMDAGSSKEDAEKDAPIMQGARKMLVDWEAGVPEVVELWKMMNEWVYKGFDETYNRIGADFHRKYYESETYLLGKKMVTQGLEKNVFVKKDDGSVWIDLTADGLDEKIVQRRDGTAVYITQDIGLFLDKYEEYHCNQSIYVVGDEQIYHFKVLKLIAEKLHLPNAEALYHLSYGMVELPEGKMKSREGTVVDADDIIDEMIAIAKQKTDELGKVKDFTETDLKELYETIGLGALKFFLLRVDPKKRMIFNPQDSIDFHGFTGPFVQYTYARIKSILRKLTADISPLTEIVQSSSELLPLEKELIIMLEQFGATIEEAANEYDSSKIVLYVFNLAKLFNSFYAVHSIVNAESEDKKSLRLQIAALTAQCIKTGMGLLGIKVPERM